MQTASRSVLATSLALAFAPMAASVASAASPPSGAPTVTSAPVAKLDGAAIVRGAGQVRPSGSPDWLDTSTGDILTAGVTLRASDQAPLEMTLPDGVTITLDPGALVQWGHATKLPSEANHFTRGYHLLLEDGELEVRMPPGPKGEHAFLVSTRAGTLTDWRGQIHIMVHGDMTAAAIYQGALVVGSNGQGFPVYDGAGIVIRRGVNPDKTRGIPPAPAWDNGANALALVAGATGATLDFSWHPVTDAANYRVEIATDPSMVRTVVRSSTNEVHFSAPEPAAGGRYWARVRAVRAEGIVGEWSPARPLRVVHYQIPEGAFVASDGAIVLPQGATVDLSNRDGLEVAYEGVREFAAPTSVPLYWTALAAPLRLRDDAPMRIAHLRDTALNAEAHLVLARRELKADVNLEPRNARWPPDPIGVSVVLRDPSGRIDTTQTAVTLEAMLNLTPLPVDWQRRGGTWTGRIAPHPIGGPSVIRIRVVDERGTEIGGAFVEVDR
jgi:hypothetical protein